MEILPMVVVAILALVGNSFDGDAVSHAATSSVASIVWLFGVTILLLISPLIVFMMVKGEGMASAGSQIGNLSVVSITRAATYSAMAMQQIADAPARMKKAKEYIKNRINPKRGNA